jgi:antimicrobial peptide system SdpA family protein
VPAIMFDDTSGSAAPTPGVHEDRRDAAMGITVLAVAAAVLGLAMTVFRASLPTTPFGGLAPTHDERIARLFVPEGWAFFTRSPRTPLTHAYGSDGAGSWTVLTTGSQATPANLMGLNRRARSQGTEISMLIHQIPTSAWSPCRGQPTDCLSGLRTGLTVANRSTHRSVCGDVGIVLQDVTPWAWRTFDPVMPSRVVRVVVLC